MTNKTRTDSPQRLKTQPHDPPYTVRVNDTTLRDGSHAVSHQFTVQQVRDVAGALERAGIQVIEVSHGDGLGGSTFNYGFSKVDEFELISAAAEAAPNAKIAALALPGLARLVDIDKACDHGIRMLRVATHCTEADISPQYFERARNLGLETAGFLMLSHMADPCKLAEQARIMVDAGCQCVNVVDSAGHLVMEEVSDRVDALVQEIGDEAQVGYHGHQNLSLGVANSVLAVRAGAKQIDGSLAALGAGAGNSPTELLATVFERLDIQTGLDANALIDAAEDIVRPLMTRTPIMDRSSVIQGKAGVYNSFLFHAERAAKRYGVPAAKILEEVGRRKLVGGQEDMIIDVAIALRDGK